MSFDTSQVPDGSHSVQVVVEDASGTRTPAAAGTVLVKNATQVGPGSPTEFRGSPNGSLDADQALIWAGWADTARAPRKKASIVKRCATRPAFAAVHPVWCNGRAPQPKITSNWSKTKTRDLIGRLTSPEGAPIVGASLDVYGTQIAEGGATRGLATLTTDANGYFATKIPRADGSLAIGVRWRSHQGDTIPVAVADVTSVVRGATGLTADDRSARRGQRIRFSGTLRGKSGNLRRVPISLQVRNGGRWKTFATATTGSRGKWATRVKFTSVRGTYKVRARVGTASAYPYARGKSTRTIKIRVR